MLKYKFINICICRSTIDGGVALKLILQAEASECGLACLSMICSSHGHSESLIELRRRFPVALTGSSLKSLMMIGDAIGLSSRAVRCDLAELGKLETPCILHWNLDHYVVLSKVSRNYATIYDPAVGLRKLSLPEVSRFFTGVALELTPAPHFTKKKHAEPIRLGDLWSRLSGFYLVIGQLFVLALLTQGIGTLMPLANQIVIDDVLGHGDRDLLISILIGFGTLAIVQSAIDVLRGYIGLHAGQRLSIQLSGNLLKHLLRLPTDFFERRHVGDIMSRFSSLAPVQGFLTGGIISAVLDAIFVVPVGVIMVVYSPLLSALVVIDIVLVLAVRAATFARSRRFADESITLGARTQSIFLETIRAFRPIKIAGREAERHAIWQNAVAGQQNLTYSQSVFNMWGGTGFGLVRTAQGLFLMFLGAREVIDGQMTLGMLMAFQSYAGQFSGRTNALIGQYYSFRMLGLHLERLGDIVHADQETGLDIDSGAPKALEGAIELRDVCFRYAPQEPWTLKNVNMHIRPGERIALIGRSGGGKTTLLKLLTGLYQPTDGRVLIDDVPMRTINIRNFRQQIGVVMQDDQLLSGTIADNIAFFDAEIDMKRVEAVCRIAHIHDDIMLLPMAYHSLVGDMGSVLSAGQKQRVLLARALYREPKVLFMDEGTANLDMALEDAILGALKALDITQIMVAHRQAVIDYCDRSFTIGEASVVETTSRNVNCESVA